MNCSQHKKEVAGIEDMKVLAEEIGNLHYKTLAELFKELYKKFQVDAVNDFYFKNHPKLGKALWNKTNLTNEYT